jgi:hypothetical protein
MRLNLETTTAFRDMLEHFRRDIRADSLVEAIRRAVIFAARMSEPGTRAFVRRKDGTETEVVL